MERTFYRRPLPASLVAFSSEEGKRRFKEALANGTAEAFFPLIEQFQTQSEPAYCGLTTLSVVLNALAIDPQRVWKGPWRWFSDELLDCCRNLEDVQKVGVSLDEFTCLARCNGATARTFRDADEFTWREHLQDSCRRGENFIASSFNRKGLGQTGSGHFSPVAAYHQETDSVLVLDVARFKYSPFWVDTMQLFNSMKTEDPSTGRPRGFVVLARPQFSTVPLSCRFRISMDQIAASMETIRKEVLPRVYANFQECDNDRENCSDRLGPALAEVIRIVGLAAAIWDKKHKCEHDNDTCKFGAIGTVATSPSELAAAKVPQPPVVLEKRAKSCEHECECYNADDMHLTEALMNITQNIRKTMVYRALVHETLKSDSDARKFLASFDTQIPLEFLAMLLLAIFFADNKEFGNRCLANTDEQTRAEISALALQIRESTDYASRASERQICESTDYDSRAGAVPIAN